MVLKRPLQAMFLAPCCGRMLEVTVRVTRSRGLTNARGWTPCVFGPIAVLLRLRLTPGLGRDDEARESLPAGRVFGGRDGLN